MMKALLIRAEPFKLVRVVGVPGGKFGDSIESIELNRINQQVS